MLHTLEQYKVFFLIQNSFSLLVYGIGLDIYIRSLLVNIVLHSMLKIKSTCIANAIYVPACIDLI